MRVARLVAAAVLSSAALVSVAPVSAQQATAVGSSSAVAASAPARITAADLGALAKIREEGMSRSKVMETASWITDVYGPRLTNSPNARAAADWAVKALRGWGISNPRLDHWGPFGPGWSSEFASVRVTSPTPFSLTANITAWSRGTNGPVTGEVVVMNDVQSAADLEKYRGKLRGKFVLVSPAPSIRPQFQAPAARYSDSVLALAARPNFSLGRSSGPHADTAAMAAAMARLRASAAASRARVGFLAEEGVAGLISSGRGGGAGIVFGESVGGSRDTANPPRFVSMAIVPEQYGRILRILEKGIPVTIEANVRNTFHANDLNAANIIAEIPGSDRRLRHEVVMLGAHFDSWHYATGATDNAAGSAVMMEAMRILKTSGVPLKRTVRLGLWTGEEHGLYGSSAYVAKNFGEYRAMKLLPGHANFSTYFNLDNGTGLIRGVYMQGNAGAVPYFRTWIEPLRDLGIQVLTMEGTGGTDHVVFDRIGLPGFQFVQDPVEYFSRTHHSNVDFYERLVPEDMMKNAVIIASLAYLAANADAKLPRKPLPAPRPPTVAPHP